MASKNSNSGNRQGLSGRERRLVINAIAGTAYMILNAFKTFQAGGFPAQFTAAVEGLAVVSDQMVGDVDARNEVMQRLAEAVNPSPVSISTAPVGSGAND